MLSIKWRDLPIEEASELELDQSWRIQYEALEFQIFGFGLTIAVRPKGDAE